MNELDKIKRYISCSLILIFRGSFDEGGFGAWCVLGLGIVYYVVFFSPAIRWMLLFQRAGVFLPSCFHG